MTERRQPPSLDPEKVKELFQQLDANGDGRVDVKELTEGLSRMGVPTIPGQAQVRRHIMPCNHQVLYCLAS